jgi:GAF domain-containing protein
MERGIRFIAVAPLIESGGQRLGGFCLLDHRPHAMAQEDIADLQRFAAAAMARIDFLSVVSELAHSVVAPRRPGGNVGTDTPIW